MPKPDKTPEIGSETKVKVTIGTIVAIITGVIIVVGSAYGFHSWLERRFDNNDASQRAILHSQTNIMLAVARCWSVEDQQNWTDEIRQHQPQLQWPSPNDIVRRRLAERNAPVSLPLKQSELSASR